MTMAMLLVLDGEVDNIGACSIDDDENDNDWLRLPRKAAGWRLDLLNQDLEVSSLKSIP